MWTLAWTVLQPKLLTAPLNHWYLTLLGPLTTESGLWNVKRGTGPLALSSVHEAACLIKAPADWSHAYRRKRLALSLVEAKARLGSSVHELWTIVNSEGMRELPVEVGLSWHMVLQRGNTVSADCCAVTLIFEQKHLCYVCILKLGRILVHPAVLEKTQQLH